MARRDNGLISEEKSKVLQLQHGHQSGACIVNGKELSRALMADWMPFWQIRKPIIGKIGLQKKRSKNTANRGELVHDMCRCRRNRCHCNASPYCIRHTSSERIDRLVKFQSKNDLNFQWNLHRRFVFTKHCSFKSDNSSSNGVEMPPTEGNSAIPSFRSDRSGPIRRWKTSIFNEFSNNNKSCRKKTQHLQCRFATARWRDALFCEAVFYFVVHSRFQPKIYALRRNYELFLVQMVDVRFGIDCLRIVIYWMRFAGWTALTVIVKSLRYASLEPAITLECLLRNLTSSFEPIQSHVRQPAFNGGWLNPASISTMSTIK